MASTPRCTSVRAIDEAVAAVVAAAAEDADATRRQVVEGRLHRRDRLAPGVLHQHDRRNADVVDRPAIRLAHLLGVEHSHPVERTACARLRQLALSYQLSALSQTLQP